MHIYVCMRACWQTLNLACALCSPTLCVLESGYCTELWLPRWPRQTHGCSPWFPVPRPDTPPARSPSELMQLNWTKDLLPWLGQTSVKLLSSHQAPEPDPSPNTQPFLKGLWGSPLPATHSPSQFLQIYLILPVKDKAFLPDLWVTYRFYGRFYILTLYIAAISFHILQ